MKFQIMAVGSPTSRGCSYQLVYPVLPQAEDAKGLDCGVRHTYSGICSSCVNISALP